MGTGWLGLGAEVHIDTELLRFDKETWCMSCLLVFSIGLDSWMILWLAWAGCHGCHG
jgi:hypothetical protein